MTKEREQYIEESIKQYYIDKQKEHTEVIYVDVAKLREKGIV